MQEERAALLRQIDTVSEDSRFDGLFQAGGVANIPQLAGPFNAGSLGIAQRLAADLVNGEAEDFQTIWNRLRTERTELEQSLSPNRDVSAFLIPRNGEVTRTTWSTGREEPFRLRAIDGFSAEPAVDRYGNQSRTVQPSTGETPSSSDIRSMMEAFSRGSGETPELVMVRTIAPLTPGEGEPYVLTMRPEVHNGVPDVRRTRPPMNDEGAQTMMRDAATLLERIQELPAGDEQALEFAARMTYRIIAALPDERGGGARAHLLAWSALAQKGFLLGPIRRTGADDGFTTNPLTGRREYAFYANFLDSQIHLESEAEFVDRFEQRFDFVDRLAPAAGDAQLQVGGDSASAGDANLTPAEFINGLLPPEVRRVDPRAWATLPGKARTFEALGIQTVEPRQDAGGLLIGGVNSSETIRGLETINGLSVNTLEDLMRPGRGDPRQSVSGYLGDRDELLQIMAKDNDAVSANGMTHQQIAASMSYFIEMSNRNPHHVGSAGDPPVILLNGLAFEVEYRQWGDFQQSPFNDGSRSIRDYFVTRIDTGDTITVSPLLRDMVERYGFYEGDTRYRVDPDTWIRFLGLGGNQVTGLDAP